MYTRNSTAKAGKKENTQLRYRVRVFFCTKTTVHRDEAWRASALTPLHLLRDTPLLGSTAVLLL